MDEHLADLVCHWGGAYVISCPGPGCWHAVRRDGKGVLRADNPELLHDMIRADYGALPVPRELEERANDSDPADRPSLVLLPERQVMTRDQDCG